MLREIDLKKVSDGKFYGINDMAKADCNGCVGCSSCCRGMGASIVLDPLDTWRLCVGLGKSFEELLDTSAELNVVDGIVLPNLRMAGTEDACTFLDDNGRCAVHSLRPGLCRIFPLGRFYEEGSFRYFLQVQECPAPRSKVRIRKWIDAPDGKQYEKFVADWHYYLKDIQGYAMDFGQEDERHGEHVQALSMYILRQFYLRAFAADVTFSADGGFSTNGEFYREFYREFYARLGEAIEYRGRFL